MHFIAEVTLRDEHGMDFNVGGDLAVLYRAACALLRLGWTMHRVIYSITR